MRAERVWRSSRHTLPVAQPSEELMTFALGALEHATGSVVDSGGPLVPFAMSEVNGNELTGRLRKRVQAIDIAALIARQQPLF